jgi:hypothetical protein
MLLNMSFMLSSLDYVDEGIFRTLEFQFSLMLMKASSRFKVSILADVLKHVSHILESGFLLMLLNMSFEF